MMKLQSDGKFNCSYIVEKYDPAIVLIMAERNKSFFVTDYFMKEDTAVYSQIIKELDDLTVAEIFDSDTIKMKQCLAVTGLGQFDYFDASVKDLSQTEKIRLFISYCIHTGSKLVLLEEISFADPVSDDNSTGYFLNIYKSAQKHGLHIFMVTYEKQYLDHIFADVIFYDNGGNDWHLEEPDVSLLIKERILDKLVYREGTLEDYQELARYHYIPVPDSEINYIYCVVLNDNVVAATLLASPINEVGQNNIDRNIIFEFIKTNIITAKRIVISPYFRGIGLGKNLNRYSVEKTDATLIEARSSIMKSTNAFDKWGGREVSRNYRNHTPCYDSLADFLKVNDLDINDASMTGSIKRLDNEKREQLKKLVLERLCEIDTHQWMYYEQLVRMCGCFSEEQYRNAQKDYIDVFQQQYCDIELERLLPLSKKWDSVAYVFKGL